jgi:hypothetical protein
MYFRTNPKDNQAKNAGKKAAIKEIAPPIPTTKMSTRPTNRGGESIEQRLKVINKYRFIFYRCEVSSLMRAL